ncbi:MAG: FAD-dependent oxidoreductase [Rhodospirillales bacterium]|nr:FAD-dependent oxidoreductase [Rhodospirillales bacterium]
MKLTRRDFGKLTTAGVASASVASVTGVTPGQAATEPLAALTSIVSREVDLPAAKGHRVVVVGGGWSGLSIAKYLKIHGPDLDVVLVERRSVFVSHPISGLWLAGMVNLEAITFSYLDAAANNNYAYLNASLIDLDRVARKIYTDQGWLAYDDLVLAPGVDYDYASIGVEDPAQEQQLKTRFPAGFVSASEHITLHNKVKNFKGGVFVLTAPPGIYRCSATPYERACLMASVFKRENIKGKILMIDSREEPAVMAEGFLAAFDELYGDIIEYMPSTTITGVDPETRTLSTDFDDLHFHDAAIYPRIRGARLLERLGLADPKSVQKEAAIDPITYNVLGEEHVYAAGDCRPMPFSKSGGTARSEGIYLAKLIAARVRGEQVAWESPHTICYSMVNTAPAEAIMVDGKYRFDAASGQWQHFENFAINKRDEAKGLKAFEWAEEHFRDMFS